MLCFRQLPDCLSVNLLIFFLGHSQLVQLHSVHGLLEEISLLGQNLEPRGHLHKFILQARDQGRILKSQEDKRVELVTSCWQTNQISFLRVTFLT